MPAWYLIDEVGSLEYKTDQSLDSGASIDFNLFFSFFNFRVDKIKENSRDWIHLIYWTALDPFDDARSTRQLYMYSSISSSSIKAQKQN